MTTDRVSEEDIAAWRKLRECGMASAVGEYTPDEFWLALDEIERLHNCIRDLRAERDALQELLRQARLRDQFADKPIPPMPKAEEMSFGLKMKLAGAGVIHKDLPDAAKREGSRK
jgi:hypothetical protein